MDKLVDTHCHLNHGDFHDLNAVLRRAAHAGVSRMICVGYDLPSSQRAVELAQEHDSVYAAVGVHPHDAEGFSPEIEAKIVDLAADSRKVVAVGETGLDYYRDLSPRPMQQQAYRTHIKLAQTLDLPLIVHSRQAWEDVIRVLDDEGMPARGVVMHCFAGEPEFGRAAVERGCFIGIAGPITFLNAEGLRGVAAGIPAERLLVETDAPYLAPHPHRGRRNEPCRLPLIAARLAEATGTTPSRIAALTTSNATELFSLGTNS